MASRTEKTLHLAATVLGICASLIAVQQWLGTRSPGRVEQHAASAMLRLHGPDRGAAKPAASQQTQTAGAVQAFAPGDAPAAGPAAAPSIPSATAAAPPASRSAPVAPPAPGNAAAPPTPAAPPAAAPREAAADPFLALVNAEAGARAGLAAAVRGEGAARLLSGLEQRGVSLLRGFFRGGFSQSAYFSQLLAGDGSSLRRVGSLASGARVMVGELEPSFQPAEMGLVVCDLSFNYVVLDARGRRVAQRSISVSVPGDGRAAALNDAVAMLLNDHGATLARDAGG